MTSTRSSESILYVGFIRDTDFHECKQLPIQRSVLERLFYYIKKQKKTINESCQHVADEVIWIWDLASLPTSHKPYITKKIRLIYEAHEKLMKNRKRDTPTETEKRKKFSKELETLFDAAHSKADTILKSKEDLAFLEDQKGPRKMFISTLDKDFIRKLEKRRKRDEYYKKCSEKAKILKKICVHEEEDVVFSSSDNEKSNDEFKPSISSYRSKSQVKNNPKAIVEDKDFVTALDRTGTSLRKAMYVVAPALVAAGVNLDEITLSTSSIYRSRTKTRSSIAHKIKEAFNPNTPLILHFDGKLVPDILGGKTERLPIVVSGKNIEKLLAIPKLPNGTGEAIGSAVLEVLNDWPSCMPWVAALCFDTTASNTGIHTGACTKIQNSVDRHLLFLACRHHIHELIIAGVFDLFFISSGPDIALFSRFKAKWSTISKSGFQPFQNNNKDVLDNWVEEKKEEIITYLDKELKKKQDRDDYKEFLELCLLFLGKSPVNRLQSPGAYHRARWMAKCIYCLKIYLCRNVFELTLQENKSLHRICIFIATIYVKAWFNAPNAADAPINDLNLLCTLEDYQLVDEKIGKTAYEKF